MEGDKYTNECCQIHLCMGRYGGREVWGGRGVLREGQLRTCVTVYGEVWREGGREVGREIWRL